MSEKIAAFFKTLWIAGRITEVDLNIAVSKNRITNEERANIMSYGVLS